MHIICNKIAIFFMIITIMLIVINQINVQTSIINHLENKNIVSQQSTKQKQNTKNLIQYKNKAYYMGNTIIVNKEYKLDKNYTYLDNQEMYNQATVEFENMVKDASMQGIYIKLSSRYRSYQDQTYIYNSYKLRSSNVDDFSAKPGYSEHQTGLAFDVMAIDQSTRLKTSFENTKEFKWLEKNAYKYGFILRYPKGKSNITGYQYEPWHYRYVGKKLSYIIHDNKLTLEEYFNLD